MSAPRFAVETVRGNIGLLIEPGEFATQLCRAAAAYNLDLTLHALPELAANPSAPLPGYDSWLIVLSPSLATFFIGEGRGVWSTLTTYPHPHLYVVEKAWEQFPLELPTHSTRILLGEYLGLDGLGSPTVTAISRALSQSAVCTLQGGGLSSLHLMSSDFVVRGLLQVLVSQSQAPHLSLGNDNGISLASLLQLYAEAARHPLRIEYQPHGLAAALPESFYRATHALFSDLPKTDSLELALSALRHSPPAPVVPPPPTPTPLPPPPASPPPKPRLPKLERPAPAPTPLAKTYNFSNLEFVPVPRPRPKKKFAFPKLLRHKTPRILLKGVLLGCILYLGTLALALGVTLVTLNNFRSQFLNGTLENLRPNQFTKLTANYLYTNAVALGFDDVSLLLDGYRQILKLSDTTASLALHAKALSSHILTDSDVNLPSVLTNTRLEIENLYSQLSLLDGSLPAATPRLLTRYQSDYQDFKGLLLTLKKNTLLAKGVVSILPDLISLNDRTKYLVLFQNNMELRGTGGFIGSYGLLSFEKGKLYDFQVYDVYTADGALKGHVEPPAPIKNILGEAKWYLRDSNFDPDFPTSARRAEWFLKKSMNQDVAGTIALNLETLRLLLQTLGPLELPDYQETITAGNLTERAQFHAEVNFFPGSTAKKEFLSSVSDALFAKLKTADSKTLFKLSSALLTSLESSDTQLSVNSDSSERVLQTLGWNGGIESKPCPTTPCYDDYYYSVDSNFGVNKANYYLTKETNLDITVSKDGLPLYTATTTWKNHAKSNAWPAGSYKNYTRLYLPPSSQVLEVRLGDNLLSPTNYTLTEEHGRLVLSYLLTVPIDSTTQSTVLYTNNTSLKSGSFYTLYYQRQSGSRPDDKYHITYNLPLYLKPTKLSPQPAIVEPQKLQFEFVNDTDHRLSIQF